MQTFQPPRIKICCIGSIEEARLAVRYGASAIGLVARMPSGPGVIPEPLIAEIAVTAPPGVATFLLTSHQDAASIIAQQQRCHTNTIQICDRLEGVEYRDLRRDLPAIKLVQVIHVTGEESLAEAQHIAAMGVDAILLDSGNQRLPVKELGGTGRTHDWSLSRRICEAINPVPLFLAGGLRAENIAAAISAVRPFGVDVCSGVRGDGRLNEELLSGFVDGVHKA